jgi:hypothetical protein
VHLLWCHMSDQKTGRRLLEDDNITAVTRSTASMTVQSLLMGRQQNLRPLFQHHRPRLFVQWAREDFTRVPVRNNDSSVHLLTRPTILWPTFSPSVADNPILAIWFTLWNLNLSHLAACTRGKRTLIRGKPTSDKGQTHSAKGQTHSDKGQTHSDKGQTPPNNCLELLAKATSNASRCCTGPCSWWTNSRTCSNRSAFVQNP